MCPVFKSLGLLPDRTKGLDCETLAKPLGDSQDMYRHFDR
jgi:hypothetical protein